MKILYVSSLVFRKASSASIRNVSLIRALIDKGHQVDVLTVKYPECREDNFLKSFLTGHCKIIQTDLPTLNKYLVHKSEGNQRSKSETFIRSSWIFNLIKNTVKLLYFFPDTDKEWLKRYKNKIPNTLYDILITSSDTKTSHFIGSEIKRENRCKSWYQIWGDPWKEDVNLPALSRFRAGLNEASLLKQADVAYYVSPATTQLMKKNFLTIQDKIQFLGRSYLTEIIGKPLGNCNEWVFSYTGSVNSNRNISALVRCIENYNVDIDGLGKGGKRIRLDIWGVVDDKVLNDLNNRPGVHLKGSVDTSAIRDIYAGSDILVFTDNGSKGSQIPGKLFDYYGSDRPILALVTDLNSLVSSIIISEGRCIVQENDTKKINFDFLENICRKEVLKEYSGRCVADRIIEKAV